MAEISARIEEEVERNDGEMVSVRIAEFYSPKVVPFDLFVKMGAGKYLRIFRAGENYDEPELRAYESDRGLRYVFFALDQRQRYLSATTTLFHKLYSVATVPLRTKFGVARILAELYMQEVYACTDEQRPQLVEKGKEICSLIAAWLEGDPRVEQHLLSLEQIDPTNEEISFLTGLFACALARRFPWKSRRSFEALLLASFLSDIGLYQLPPDVVRTKPKRMNSKQRTAYEKHPEISYLLLEQVGGLSENILTVVRQHHEYCDGSGFPQQLTANKTLLLSKITVLCGDLVRASSEYLLPPNEAVKVLFPYRSAKVFTERPELVSKYDRDLIIPFFEIFGKLETEAAA